MSKAFVPPLADYFARPPPSKSARREGSDHFDCARRALQIRTRRPPCRADTRWPPGREGAGWPPLPPLSPVIGEMITPPHHILAATPPRASSSGVTHTPGQSGRQQARAATVDLIDNPHWYGAAEGAADRCMAHFQIPDTQRQRSNLRSCFARAPQRTTLPARAAAPAVSRADSARSSAALPRRRCRHHHRRPLRRLQSSPPLCPPLRPQRHRRPPQKTAPPGSRSSGTRASGR